MVAPGDLNGVVDMFDGFKKCSCVIRAEDFDGMCYSGEGRVKTSSVDEYVHPPFVIELAVRQFCHGMTFSSGILAAKVAVWLLEDDLPGEEYREKIESWATDDTSRLARYQVDAVNALRALLAESIRCGKQKVKKRNTQ